MKVVGIVHQILYVVKQNEGGKRIASFSGTGRGTAVVAVVAVARKSRRRRRLRRESVVWLMKLKIF